MNKNLEARIEERKKDAMDREIAFKGSVIAKKGVCVRGCSNIFGKFIETYKFRNKQSLIMTYTIWPTDIRDGGYEEDRIAIYDSRSNIPGGNVFCQVNGEILVYRPDGRWEHELDILYNQLLSEEKAKAERDDKKLEEAEEADLKKRFGL